MDRMSRIGDDTLRPRRDRKLAQDLGRRCQFRDSADAYIVRAFIHDRIALFFGQENHDTASCDHEPRRPVVAKLQRKGSIISQLARRTDFTSPCHDVPDTFLQMMSSRRGPVSVHGGQIAFFTLFGTDIASRLPTEICDAAAVWAGNHRDANGSTDIYPSRAGNADTVSFSPAAMGTCCNLHSDRAIVERRHHG